MPAKVSLAALPWVTYTDPELAHVGLQEADARRQHGAIKVLNWSYSENDRAIAEHKTFGKIKVITDRKGRILGASILGENAGELIQMWTLAITQKLKIRAMTGFISPYPTYSEISKRVAYTYYTENLTNPVMRRIIKWLQLLG
jgi:pyruvate/2-oxoglutarate dehydrogenase complex dihydrolipoamide dehydrogenase (E3) component